MCYKHAQLNPFLDIVEVFFTFWWDQEMNELKEKSIASCKLWKEAGKPRSGSIFNEYRCDNSAYRNGLRRKQQLETEIYTNDLHDALLQKQDTAFWHCWKSQFDMVGLIVAPFQLVVFLMLVSRKLCFTFCQGLHP